MCFASSRFEAGREPSQASLASASHGLLLKAHSDKLQCMAQHEFPEALIPKLLDMTANFCVHLLWVWPSENPGLLNMRTSSEANASDGPAMERC